MSALNKNSTVAQWVCEHPQTARVFEEWQLDYCCGGNTALLNACETKKLNADEIMTQLARVVANPQQESTENWTVETLTSLCNHIQQTHHEFLRQELPRLTALLEKVVAAHGVNHAELRELQQVFAVLRSELEPHMFKEEQILFPAIREMEQGAHRPSYCFGTVANPIRMMEHEHDAAGNALAQMRELTNGFVAPPDACNTYRVMLDSLHALERDMHQHVHKENNILFPRAQELETSLDNTTKAVVPPM